MGRDQDHNSPPASPRTLLQARAHLAILASPSAQPSNSSARDAPHPQMSASAPPFRELHPVYTHRSQKTLHLTLFRAVWQSDFSKIQIRIVRRLWKAWQLICQQRTKRRPRLNLRIPILNQLVTVPINVRNIIQARKLRRS